MATKSVGWWFLLLGFLTAACALSPAAVTSNRPESPTETAVVITAIISPTPQALPATQTAVPSATPPPSPTPVIAQPLATSVATPSATFAAYGVPQIIGGSAGGRSIESYRFGFGSQTIVLVGGMHGGYEWNTIVLAYEMIDYFLENPDQIPANISLYIIPSANPDGQFAVTGVDGRFTSENVTGDIRRGRFNDNQVDLNRNWACDWQAEALWGDTLVSGGSTPFSEPETAALRAFLLYQRPEVAVFWHSKADGIFVGSCGEDVPSAQEIAAHYSAASGYTVYEEFTAYPISGDASDWLATQNIPSFTVELKTRNLTDWSENLAGVLALLDYYGR